jgi:thiamine pyrophosphokinase
MKHKGLKYVSFIPISHEVHGITLEGFKYPLKNCHIHLGSTLCISNELINELGTFSFHDGIILMIRSRD